MATKKTGNSNVKEADVREVDATIMGWADDPFTQQSARVVGQRPKDQPAESEAEGDDRDR